MDYFSLFSIPRSFDLDENLLEKKYFELQRQYHPDRFTGKSDQEKIAALGKSTDINHAYKILGSPIKRAEYLLSLEGIKVNTEADSVKPSQKLLMEVINLREKLFEVESQEQIDELKNFTAKEIAVLLQDISIDFNGNDLKSAAEDTIRLQYLTKLQDEINLKKKVAI